MIVISGVLVLVALVLLIIGVVGPDLTFVYASIGVSLVSLVFLVIGILQRRGETPAAEAAAPAPEVAQEPADSVTAVVPSQAARSSMRKAVEEAPVAETAAEEPAAGGTVLVVEGRPRYHVEGCRYLTGKTAESVEVGEARDEGFSPCGVCKPDEALAAGPAEEPAAQEPAPVVEEDVPGVEVPEPTRTATRAVKAPAKKAAAKKAPAKAAAPATKVAAKAAAKAPSKAPTKVASKAPTKAPSKAPSKAATAAAAATPAAATAAKKAGSVVVIPDRGKFHRAECRFVRDVEDAEVLSKTAATRQGYAACGVCKP